MSNSIPQSGEFYKHFKGNLYQIITIAKDSEDLSDIVVYQALYGDYKTYVRPLDMFISKVDSDKYPDITQTYRFQKIDISKYSNDNNTPNPDIISEKTTHPPLVTQDYITEESRTLPLTSPEDVIPEGVNPNLIKFLDSDTYHKKLEIFNLMKDNIDINTLHSISAVLDITPEGDSTEDNYYVILKHLETQVKFERQGR